jgi:transcriptional regulator with XRE-family HTH domain
MRQLGQALASARERAGLSQSELVRRLGRERSYVAHIERGDRNISLATLAALGDALELRCVIAFSDF